MQAYIEGRLQCPCIFYPRRVKESVFESFRMQDAQLQFPRAIFHFCLYNTMPTVLLQIIQLSNETTTQLQRYQILLPLLPRNHNSINTITTLPQYYYKATTTLPSQKCDYNTITTNKNATSKLLQCYHNTNTTKMQLHFQQH